MIWHCNDCHEEFDEEYIVKKEDYFDHAFGVKYLYTYHCPFCDSEKIEEGEDERD